MKCRFAREAERERALSSMPAEMPFCKKQAERAHALSFLSSMPGEMPVCKNKPKEKFGCFMVPKRGVGWAWGGQK